MGELSIDIVITNPFISTANVINPLIIYSH